MGSFGFKGVYALPPSFVTPRFWWSIRAPSVSGVDWCEGIQRSLPFMHVSRGRGSFSRAEPDACNHQSLRLWCVWLPSLPYSEAFKRLGLHMHACTTLQPTVGAVPTMCKPCWRRLQQMMMMSACWHQPAVRVCVGTKHCTEHACFPSPLLCCVAAAGC